MNPLHAAMFVYALHEPIDDFDALTPLPQWIAADPTWRTRWTLQAILALGYRITPPAPEASRDLPTRPPG